MIVLLSFCLVIIFNVMHKQFLKNQGDFNCGASSKADFILNNFLANFLKFRQISF